MLPTITLRWKLTGAAGIVAGMIVLGTLVGQVGMAFGVDAERELAEQTLPALEAGWRLHGALHELAQLQARTAPGGVEPSWNEVDSSLALVAMLPRNKDDEAKWRELSDGIQAWRAGNRDAASRATSAIEQMIETRTAVAATAHQQFSRGVSAVRLLVLGSGGLGVLIVLSLGAYSAWRLSRTLSQAVVSISSGTSALETTSEALAGESNQLGSGLELQSEAMKRTSSAMGQLTEVTHRNTARAQQAQLLAQTTASTVNAADSQMKGVVVAMEELGRTGASIGAITRVINDLAFQSNVLALNAMVEAARAGDAGAAFSVVAQEVQALAQRTASSAADIEGLLNNSTARISEVTTLAQKTGQSFAAVVSSVDDVTRLVRHISQASAEQAQGIDELGNAVGHMDQAANQSGLVAEELTNAVHGLETQASALAIAALRIRELVDGDESPRGAA